ncbi:MAG: NAD-dependent DNA ligase LigA [Patescibacteria group bacterium]|nr:NAD-dependent DNA ligase LigA [Patescibacteria group bacterium]
MDKKQAKQRIEKLKEVIFYHRHLYHVLDRQEIPDAALDSLKKELFDLEQEFPEFITLDSPSQRIGGKALDKFEKIKHLEPMLSFNDAFSRQDIDDWIERISRLLTKEEVANIDFYCELKIDGLAIELFYSEQDVAFKDKLGRRILKNGSTRGDGKIGEDVTQNLKTINSIPLKIEGKEKVIENIKRYGLIKKHKLSQSLVKAIQDYNPKEPIIVRGEVFIAKKEFDKINQEREKTGLPLYSNPRNLAAGSIRQLDSKIASARNLDFFAYDLISNFKEETHEEKHQILKEFGFYINPYNKYCANIEKVFEFYEDCQKLREKLPYEIDGIVLIVNSNKIFKKLGTVGKTPRGAIALKFPLEKVTTIVRDIRVQVGRTGVLTPVAFLKPVQVGGVIISRATLHNQDEIKRLGIKIGDTVIVGRAGDVIPDILKVLKDLRTGKEKEFKMPLKCPICGSNIVKIKGEVMSRCVNPKCLARQKKYFFYFVSKKAFDIDGLGPKIIEQLVESNLIADPSDLFELKQGDLLFLKGFAEKSAEKLVKEIQQSKEITFPKFIYALGIKTIGEETAQNLADHFKDIKGIKNALIEDLERIKDIGPVSAKLIYQWFKEEMNLKFLEKLMKLGIQVKTQNSNVKTHKLEGLGFVLTGALDSITREEAKKKIKELGGRVSESVSKKTNFLVIGKDPGSKYEKAKTLGVKIVKEKHFLEMLNN